ncbi:hypothetical protein WJX84_005145 [Apatococcus fuscideae]|uniref:Uncharacterized protein n=1 Tax=Apatococcus fuscideae TaxID=2026836 RepID=A0AAW1RHS1_9CHLO
MSRQSCIGLRNSRTGLAAPVRQPPSAGDFQSHRASKKVCSAVAALSPFLCLLVGQALRSTKPGVSLSLRKKFFKPDAGVSRA